MSFLEVLIVSALTFSQLLINVFCVSFLAEDVVLPLLKEREGVVTHIEIPVNHVVRLRISPEDLAKLNGTDGKIRQTYVVTALPTGRRLNLDLKLASSVELGDCSCVPELFTNYPYSCAGTLAVYSTYENVLTTKICGELTPATYRMRSQQFVLKFLFDESIPEGMSDFELAFYIRTSGGGSIRPSGRSVVEFQRAEPYPLSFSTLLIYVASFIGLGLCYAFSNMALRGEKLRTVSTSESSAT